MKQERHADVSPDFCRASGSARVDRSAPSTTSMARKRRHSGPSPSGLLSRFAPPAAAATAAAGNRLKRRLRSTALCSPFRRFSAPSPLPCRPFLLSVHALSSICKQKCNQLPRPSSCIASKLRMSARQTAARSASATVNLRQPPQLGEARAYPRYRASRVSSRNVRSCADLRRASVLSRFSHLRVSRRLPLARLAVPTR